mmetsp:Transcript_25985/g.84583  ORF Transcript_25985/g.84583 Transcript_25985/m.84583 type:complete len:256 (+) Transcript_25985:57-824(+)
MPSAEVLPVLATVSVDALSRLMPRRWFEADLPPSLPRRRRASPAGKSAAGGHRLRALAVWVAALLLFWGSVCALALHAAPVSVTLDGHRTSLNGLKFAWAWGCALRPDRLYSWGWRRQAEPICVKQPLQALAGRSFERLCVLPDSINKCFDWDVGGTRWARVGFSLGDAYKELGLSSRPASWYSAKEVKAAYRQLSLQLHPDKIRGASPEARREAENRFMRVQRAYHTVTDHRAFAAAPRESPRARSRSTPPSAR